MLHHPDGSYKQSSGLGRYATDLLCDVCDGILGRYEDSAFRLLKRLRSVDIGRKAGSQSYIKEGTYKFRVQKTDEFVRFACGILWKYASLPETEPMRIDLGSYRDVFQKFLFVEGNIPSEVDVFLERDLLSFAAFNDPKDVYYYCTPSVGQRGKLRPLLMSWFSVGGFIIYVKLDKGRSDFAPTRCWMKGRKEPHFLVSMRSIEVNKSVAISANMIEQDLVRLNRRLSDRLGLPKRTSGKPLSS
jgi:hypothetical protein